MTPDYYTLLGVSRGAEAEIIRAAYLTLARRYHPDAATAASPHNAEKFRLITEAYEVLRDPRRREYYDWGHSRQEQHLDEPEQWMRPQEEQAHRQVRAPAKITWSSALANPLVYSAGAIALVVALVFGLIGVILPNVPSADTDLAMRTEKSEQSASSMSDAVVQELTDLRRTLQLTERLAAKNQEALAQERSRIQELGMQLAARDDSDKLLAQERARSQELEKQLAARGDSDKLLAQERSRSQELEKQLAARGDGDKLLAQERSRSEELEKQLAARGEGDKLLAQERARSQELEKQLAARGDSDKLLAQERTRSQELEKQLAARSSDSDKQLAQERARIQELEKQLAARDDSDKLLAQERARSQELEKQLAARQHAIPARDHNAMASSSDKSPPTPPAASEPATAPLPRSDKPSIAAADNPVPAGARPEAPRGNPEATRLMARATMLLGQGNIGAARIVLQSAAEMGSAPALFALAETYDPAVLSAWGTLGTQGDAHKAQELYAKAFASGIQEAKDRLNALRY